MSISSNMNPNMAGEVTTSSAGSNHWLPVLIAGVQSAIVGLIIRNAARRDLSALDDRMLRDIGISRCEIDAVVLGRSHVSRNNDLSLSTRQ
jgi:hypothetical protein